MAIIMEKYNLNKRTYLVYDVMLNNRNFTSRELALIARDESGVSVDEVIVLDGNKITSVAREGYVSDPSLEALQIAKHYRNEIKIEGIREYEVRFTLGYIKKLVEFNLQRAYIA